MPRRGHPCRCCGCSLCSQGKLPDTVTVAISGYIDGQLKGNQLGFVDFASNYGSGASALISAPVGTPGPISAITMTDGGNGYARFARAEPSATVEIAGGSNAQLQVSFREITHNGRAAWEVAAVTIVAGGSGYEYGFYDIVPSAGSVRLFRSRVEIDVDAEGRIFSAVVPWWGAGVFYRDDTTNPGEVATVTVSVRQYREEGGIDPNPSGAILQAVVDNIPSSATFGKITGVTISNGGSGYVAWKYRERACCADYWNGKTVVLKLKRDRALDYAPFIDLEGLDAPKPCVYDKLLCGITGGTSVRGSMGGRSVVSVEYRGPSLPPIARVSYIGQADPCYVTAVASEPIANCDGFSFTATSPDNVSFQVTPGGDFDAEEHYNTTQPQDCFPCCRDLDEVPEEITAKLFKKNNVTNVMELQGTYVLSRWNDNTWRLVVEPLSAVNNTGKIIEVSIEQCQRGPWGGNVVDDGSYPGDAIGCADCWKKCTVVASWFHQGVGFYRSDRCVGCATSPMCSPTPGTRQLRLVRIFTTAADGPDVQLFVQNGPVGDYAIEVEA